MRGGGHGDDGGIGLGRRVCRVERTLQPNSCAALPARSGSVSTTPASSAPAASRTTRRWLRPNARRRRRRHGREAHSSSGLTPTMAMRAGRRRRASRRGRAAACGRRRRRGRWFRSRSWCGWCRGPATGTSNSRCSRRRETLTRRSGRPLTSAAARRSMASVPSMASTATQARSLDGDALADVEAGERVGDAAAVVDDRCARRRRACGGSATPSAASRGLSRRVESASWMPSSASTLAHAADERVGVALRAARRAA